jgi:hypothetical protein
MKLALVLLLSLCIVTSSQTEDNLDELSDKIDYNEEHQTGENHIREARGINMIFFLKLYRNYKIIIFLKGYLNIEKEVREEVGKEEAKDIF